MVAKVEAVQELPPYDPSRKADQPQAASNGNLAPPPAAPPVAAAAAPAMPELKTLPPSIAASLARLAGVPYDAPPDEGDDTTPPRKSGTGNDR
ncbi:MAG: hypothetical protein KDJ36_02570 [Hyphomicrobiaceae bacterium]|nr:hypothetical protein [Hyphomicrobiaceae bacterium]